MKIQGSVMDESKYQKWGENVIYVLFVNLKKVLLMKKRVLACFRVMKQLRMPENPWCQRASFTMPCPSGSVSFALHLTIFLVNLRSHSQWSLRKVRTTAHQRPLQSCTMASFVITVAVWHVQTWKPESSVYCCPLVFVSVLITWTCLICLQISH